MRSTFSALAVCALLLPSFAEAEELRYLLRVSPEALAEIRRAEFSHEQTITDSFLGTEIEGTAKTNGKCAIESRGGKLRIVIAGESVSKTQGINGPAIIDSTTTTTFTAVAPITFDPEKGFVAREIEIDAKSQMQTDKIGSSQSGVSGAIVRKLAAKKVAAAKAEAEQHAQELATKRLRGEIAPEIAARMKKLNSACEPLAPVLALLKGEADDCTLHAHEGSLIVSSRTADEQLLASMPKAAERTEVLVASKGINASLGSRLGSVTTHRVTRSDAWWVIHSQPGKRID